MKLNEKLAELRKARGLTQHEIAEALDVSRQAVSRWEVGTATPTLDNLSSLSRLYGVPLDHIIQEEAGAEIAELAKKGESKLTQEEIEEYSGKCDMTQMSPQEYKDFINFLADRGVIEHPEPLGFDPGERMSYNGPQHQLLAEGAEADEKWGENADLGPRGVVYFLSSYMEERFQKLLAEQAAAEALRSAGRLV